jgi:uncharacterized membrane protein YkgB
MFKALLIIGGMLSFMLGGLIFLIGIGAIVGCAGGIIALLTGSFISLTGIGTLVWLALEPQDQKGTDNNPIIELIKQNGKWRVQEDY